MFLGLRTAIYHVPDLKSARDWYRQALEIEPYFDEPFYVGFDVGGYELGLDPDTTNDPPGTGGVVAYWGVENVEREVARLLVVGAALHAPARDVGGGITVAAVRDPFGNVLGLIENAGFEITPPGEERA